MIEKSTKVKDICPTCNNKLRRFISDIEYCYIKKHFWSKPINGKRIFYVYVCDECYARFLVIREEKNE